MLLYINMQYLEVEHIMLVPVYFYYLYIYIIYQHYIHIYIYICIFYIFNKWCHRSNTNILIYEAIIYIQQYI